MMASLIEGSDGHHPTLVAGASHFDRRSTPEGFDAIRAADPRPTGSVDSVLPFESEISDARRAVVTEPALRRDNLRVPGIEHDSNVEVEHVGRIRPETTDQPGRERSRLVEYGDPGSPIPLPFEFVPATLENRVTARDRGGGVNANVVRIGPPDVTPE